MRTITRVIRKVCVCVESLLCARHCDRLWGHQDPIRARECRVIRQRHQCDGLASIQVLRPAGEGPLGRLSGGVGLHPGVKGPDSSGERQHQGLKVSGLGCPWGAGGGRGVMGWGRDPKACPVSPAWGWLFPGLWDGRWFLPISV